MVEQLFTWVCTISWASVVTSGQTMKKEDQWEAANAEFIESINGLPKKQFYVDRLFGFFDNEKGSTNIGTASPLEAYITVSNGSV